MVQYYRSPNDIAHCESADATPECNAAKKKNYERKQSIGAHDDLLNFRLQKSDRF